jgi:hypothetical protein
MKSLLLCLAVPLLASAAILPDTIGAYHRVSAAKPDLADRPVWNDYVLKDYETVSYENGKDKFTAIAYQLQDTTGALAAFDWQRPDKSKPSNAAPLAAETADQLMMVEGNYLLVFDGHKPSAEEIAQIREALKNVDRTSLPTLPHYLPSDELVRNSERYITGAASLQKFAPNIPPSVAAFRMGAEAQYGLFSSPKGETAMLIFDYPTPQIAMQRIVEFQKIPGAVAKRSGPLVAVTVSPADPDLAEKLLSQVRYLADVTLQEHIWTKKDNIGDLVINAFILTGILLCFIIVGGLGVGLWRVWLRRGNRDPDADTVISLHLL